MVWVIGVPQKFGNHWSAWMVWTLMRSTSFNDRLGVTLKLLALLKTTSKCVFDKVIILPIRLSPNKGCT